MNDQQKRALALLNRAYDEDVPAWIATQTRFRRSDDAITIGRVVGLDLVMLGLARYSRPHGRFLLLTEAGRAAGERMKGKAT